MAVPLAGESSAKVISTIVPAAPTANAVFEMGLYATATRSKVVGERTSVAPGAGETSVVGVVGQLTVGATVKLTDTDSGDEVTYAIVGDYEGDIKQGRISISAPLARAPGSPSGAPDRCTASSARGRPEVRRAVGALAEGAADVDLRARLDEGKVARAEAYRRARAEEPLGELVERRAALLV